MRHRFVWIHIITLLLALAWLPQADAQFFGSPKSPAFGSSQKVKAVAFASATAIAPGQSGTIAIQVTIPSGLHAQAHRPLDKFLIPTQVNVPRDDNIAFGPAKYPAPLEIPSLPGLSSAKTMAVYEGEFLVLVPVTVATAATAGPQNLMLTLRLQVCNDKSCFPAEEIKMPLTLTVGPDGQSANEAIFAQAARQKFDTSADVPTTTQAASTATAPAIAPDELTQLEKMQISPQNIEEGRLSFWQYLLFALLGGAILNIMPCVLPVIPLKVMSLVQQAHGNRSVAVAHALVFAAGIVTLFVVLGLALSIYGTTTGTTVVYGKQFQSPTFLLIMAGIVLALALSMIGVWSINPPAAVYSLDQQRGGFVGSFMSGVLATLLATPCSAPFLGPVLAWAFTQPIWLSTSVLAVVGAGMAIPYILLAAFPAGIDRLPRTGRWSELVKQFFGIVMIGVAIYLLTTIPQPALWPFALAVMLIVALACWMWGQIPTYDMTRLKVWTIRTICLIVSAGLFWAAFQYLHPSNAAPIAENTAIAKTGDQLPWQPFSVAALQKGLDEGPVVIDWTATWCINCRFVEATVLHNESVQEQFRKSNALLLTADISSRHPTAELLLAKLDSRSIPVLAIFSPKDPLHPIVLRDLYSRDRVVQAVNSATK